MAPTWNNSRNTPGETTMGTIGRLTEKRDSRIPALASATSALLCSLLLGSSLAHAQPHALDDAASDPNKLGWMSGFPPASDKVVSSNILELLSFPKIRWAFCHMRETAANKRISRGVEPAAAMAEALDPAIDSVTFTPLGATEPMTWKQSLAANYTDGMLILHRGKVVYEYYNGCLTREGRHAAMSVTKSYIGMLAEMLIAEGKLDDSAPVTR